MSDVRRIVPAQPDDDAGARAGPALVGGGGFVDLRSLAAALRSRRQLVIAVAVLGALGGVFLSLASPPAPTARASILLRYPSGYDPVQAVLTETELLKTRAVADAAAARLGPGASPGSLLTGLRVKPVSNQLIHLDMVGPSGREAARRGQAVAEAFLAFRNGLFDQQAQASIDSLKARQASLDSDLAELNRQIEAQPAAARAGDTAVRGIGDLLAARATVAEQLSTVRQKIDTVRLDNAAVTSQSRIVDPAAELGRPVAPSLIRNGSAGLVLGLLLGAGWVVVWEIIGDRARHRADITAAMRAPVAVSVGAQRGPLPVHRMRLRRQDVHPSADLRHIVYHLAQTLNGDGRPRQELGVVSVASDGAAAVAVARLAAELGAEGRAVLVADCTKRFVLTRLLRRSRAAVVHTTDATPMACTVFLPGDQQIVVDDRRPEIAFDELRRTADVVLVLASLDPAAGARFLGGLTSTVVAFVTAGRSSATALHSAATMLDAAEVRLDSVVLIGTDPGDETVGLPPVPFPPSSPAAAAVEIPPLRSSQRP